MKKRIIIIAILTLTKLALVSCVATYQPIPYGVWQSENPNMTLIVDPDYASFENPSWSIVYPGTYVRDGEEIDLVVVVDNTRGRGGIRVFNASLERFSNFSDAYFVGNYRVSGGRLIYTLDRQWQEQTGFDRIVFDKTREVVVNQ